MLSGTAHFQEPVRAYARADFPRLRHHLTVGEALEAILQEGVGDQLVYFYVLDDAERLVGVVPTRRLLTTQRHIPLREIMLTRVVSLPETASVLDACEFFVLYKYLALPIVDAERRMVGLVDVRVFTDDLVSLNDRDERANDPDRFDDLFEALGFRFQEVRNASPWRAFRFRFPWLLTTIVSGTACALLAGLFADTLAESLVVAFFLTLVLGLGESVSIQSMTLTIQALNATQPTLGWYGKSLQKEVVSALLLGAACGVLVAAIVWAWMLEPVAALVVGASIGGSLLMACVLGLSVPALLHALRLDPKIAAGPVTLALTDLSTLAIYFNLARLLL